MPELDSIKLIESIDLDLNARIEQLDVQPRLAILSDNFKNEPSRVYVGMKLARSRKMDIAVEATFVNARSVLLESLDRINEDPAFHGIIVQMPMADMEDPDFVLGRISPTKDVDALGSDDYFAPATPLGILNFIEGHEIDYLDANVVILGQGRLVGAPLLKLMQSEGATNVQGFDIDTPEDEKRHGLNEADIVISAIGRAGIITRSSFDNLNEDKVFIDAGAAESNGEVKGDFADDLRRAVLDIGGRITSKEKSVGPMTVKALFSNVITATETQVALGQ